MLSRVMSFRDLQQNGNNQWSCFRITINEQLHQVPTPRKPYGHSFPRTGPCCGCWLLNFSKNKDWDQHCQNRIRPKTRLISELFPTFPQTRQNPQPIQKAIIHRIPEDRDENRKVEELKIEPKQENQNNAMSQKIHTDAANKPHIFSFKSQ